MFRLLLFVFFMVAGNSVLAAGCVDIDADMERLACFDATRKCTDLDASMERLACFDEAYRPSPDHGSDQDDRRGREGTASVTPSPGAGKLSSREEKVEVEPRPLSRQDEAGFGRREPVSPGAEFIQAVIEKVQRNSRGIDYLRLDNGQVWREVEDSRVRFREGQSVRIEKALMNSYNLQVEGIRKLIKVRRIDH